MIKKILLIILLTTVAFFVWKNLTIPKSSKKFHGRLQPCPKSPNCVSSQDSDSKHFIEPLVYQGKDPFDQIEGFLKKHYIIKVVKKTPTYLHIVVTTKVFRFKDDLEFLYYPEINKIEVRSASRLGYSDMGVNRSRIEKLREYLKQKKYQSDD